MSRIIFENRSDNEYVARNGKIDEYGLSILEDRYEHKGFSFFNDDFDDEAVMEWSNGVDPTTIAKAQGDFQNFIVHV